MSIESIAGAALVKALKKAWRKDRDHHYRLNQPWSLPRLVEPVPDYAGRYVTIEDSVITILPNGDCDGATLAPDKIGSWSFVEAAIAHDAMYGEMDAIADAWGVPVSYVRKLADSVFYAVATEHAPSWMVRVYWRAVRALGGLAHRVGKLLLVGGLLCAMVGGCQSPVDPFDQGPIDEPDYTKTAMIEWSAAL